MPMSAFMRMPPACKFPIWHLNLLFVVLSYVFSINSVRVFLSMFPQRITSGAKTDLAIIFSIRAVFPRFLPLGLDCDPPYFPIGKVPAFGSRHSSLNPVTADVEVSVCIVVRPIAVTYVSWSIPVVLPPNWWALNDPAWGLLAVCDPALYYLFVLGYFQFSFQYLPGYGT